MALIPGSLRRGRRAGFTIIELLVVLAILGVILGFSLPAIFNFIRRSEIEGTARQTASLLQLARLEAIKRSASTRVTADFAKGEIFAFVDLDKAAGPVYDPAVDQVVGRFSLPRNVFFQFQGDVPKAPSALFNLTQSCAGCPSGWAEFNSDGSFSSSTSPLPLPPLSSPTTCGSFFFGDPRNNFLEVRIVFPRSVTLSSSYIAPRIEVAKFEPTKSLYLVQGDSNVSWKWN